MQIPCITITVGHERSEVTQSSTMPQEVLCISARLLYSEFTVHPLTPYTDKHTTCCAETGVLSPGGGKGTVQVQPAGDS